MYYFFARMDRRLRYGDDRPIVVGETHTVDCDPIPCYSGLHASKCALHALLDAPGPILYRVELGGEVVHDSAKSCATERTYVSGGIDVTDVLRKFARMCALDVVGIWKPSETILKFLKTGESRTEANREAQRVYRVFRDSAYRHDYGYGGGSYGYSDYNGYGYGDYCGRFPDYRYGGLRFRPTDAERRVLRAIRSVIDASAETCVAYIASSTSDNALAALPSLKQVHRKRLAGMLRRALKKAENGLT